MSEITDPDKSGQLDRQSGDEVAEQIDKALNQAANNGLLDSFLPPEMEAELHAVIHFEQNRRKARHRRV